MKVENGISHKARIGIDKTSVIVARIILFRPEVRCAKEEDPLSRNNAVTRIKNAAPRNGNVASNASFVFSLNGKALNILAPFLIMVHSSEIL